MKVIKKAAMPDGTAIQIEDWHKDYSFLAESGTLAAYPIAKAGILKTKLGGSYGGPWYYPEAGRKFRVSFDFACAADAERVFGKLISGEAQLKDFVEHMNDPKYATCL